MPHPDVDDHAWSDSDDEFDVPDVVTSVQLGIPDGALSDPADLSDPTVSRLGGRPTFLSTPPPPSTHATCNNCSQHMELLLQVWCPMENSPNDRALFVWGCANASCQRKDGSIRAWRELRFNKKYAEKLQKRLARHKHKEAQQANAAAELAAKKAQPKSNPFALSANSAPTPFRLGLQIFAGPDLEPSPHEPSLDAAETDSAQGDASSPPSSPEPDSDSEASDNDNDDDAADALAAAVASASLSDSPWTASAAYSPLYLSTVAEYLPSPPKVKVPAGATVDMDADDDNGSRKKKDDGAGWGMEGYENSMDLDHAFERFSKRVVYEGQQCLRYDLGGTPLPFSSDKVFDKLFPVPAGPPLPVTKPDFMVTPAHKRSYVRDTLPVCPHCKSRRVFECQLMPNLISVLKSGGQNHEGGQKPLSDQERHAEVLRALKGQGGSRVRGMEWGTCMVFSCEKDCAAGAGDAGTWREEYVLVQWDE